MHTKTKLINCKLGIGHNKVENKSYDETSHNEQEIDNTLNYTFIIPRDTGNNYLDRTTKEVCLN